MKLLSRRDIAYAIITGLTAGIIAALVLSFLRQTLPFGISLLWLIPVILTLWIVGVQLGYFLGGWIGFFNQFGKFVAIGFTNFAVDAGVLNLLIAATGIAGGGWYSAFKTISFVAAVTHSYFWNRRWTFQSTGGAGTEFAKFFAVMVASAAVNVGVASLAVNVLQPAGADPKLWANLGAVAGSAIALIFSFVGFKIVVFKKV